MRTMKRLILKLIRLYQKYISSDNVGLYKCRFYPTCSEYGYQAIDKYGVIKGTVLAVWRILRCNPFNKGGEDQLR
ncbi:membrane protein insertion efficiency factor YidD [candidate division WWE3 bacterium]|uniref:Putative membrane protein insertion efficiency factor n=1 Tax=candidate division WWE3 bacterium TaxID=2053526 RepID=A0A7X9HI48_UNCKA|nr:membrane protein insertion efficiency factor YidD [candidate division WWE3 bacterium]